MGQVIAFWIFAVAIVGAALGVVLLKNVFRAAILLITCFLGVAGIFILLSADFLAAMQILIYIGAISILVILAIMLTRELSIGSPSNKFQIPALIIAALFCSGIIYAILNTNWQISNIAPAASNHFRIWQTSFSVKMVLSYLWKLSRQYYSPLSWAQSY